MRRASLRRRRRQRRQKTLAGCPLPVESHLLQLRHQASSMVHLHHQQRHRQNHRQREGESEQRYQTKRRCLWTMLPW